MLSSLLWLLSACSFPVMNASPVLEKPTHRGLLITMESIFFDFDQADLTAASLATIDGLIATLQQDENKNYVIAIDGYTDVMGKEDYNLGLSKQRAENVKHAFIERGIASQRLDAKGFGQADPIADNTTSSGRQQNRRVEILILQPLDIQPKDDS